MLPIESFEQYREITGEGKKLERVFSNCYFLPAAVKDMIARRKLFTKRVSNGILLLEREPAFYRCYYYLSMEARPEPVRLPAPAVVEFVFQQTMTQPQEEQVETLKRMGFVLGRESGRMRLDAADAPDGEAAAVALAAEADAPEVLKLIEANFDPLYAFIPDGEELLTAIRNGRVFVIRDGQTPIAVLHAEVSGGTASIRHLTVSGAYRSRGYGRMLVLFYHRAFKETVRAFSHWVDRGNGAAIRLYAGLGYAFDDRYANEYIMK